MEPVFGCGELFKAPGPEIRRRGAPGSILEKTSQPRPRPFHHRVFTEELLGVGGTVPLAVGRQASDLDRPAPSMSRGISAAHHRRWAAYAMSLGFRAKGLGFSI